jgi:predicted MFS family arabinose efflux permease
VFLAIPLGRFADRRRSETLLVFGSVLLALACAALAFGASVWALAAASVVLGVGHLSLMLGVQNAIAAESHEGQHDARFGVFTAVVSAGQLVGPLLGGAILSSGGALRPATTDALLAAGGLGAAGVVCALRAATLRSPSLDAPEPVLRGTVRRMMRTRGVPAGIFASVAVLSCVDVLTAYLPVLGQRTGIAPGVVGALLALRAAASIASRLGITTIVRWVGRNRLIAGSALVAALAVVGVTMTHDLVVIALLIAVAGFMLGFGQPLTMTMVVQLVPENARATALGLRLTGNRIGQAATPAAAGVFAGAAGVSSVFWLLGGILVASAVAVART